MENNLTILDRQSCDAVLDLDSDTLNNYIEEKYNTNPLERDRTTINADEIEVNFGAVQLSYHCGVPQNPALTLTTLSHPCNQIR